MAGAGTRALTVSEIIDRQPLSSLQISAISLCGLVLLLDGFDTQCIGFLAPSISQNLGIPLKSFGPVFSAGLVGLMVAAMAMGPLADRWGRRWPVILSVLTFAVFALLTARAASLEQLIVFRFLTGLGLGGTMPNVVALTSEYSPKRLQAVFVAMLFSGIPLGALVASSASSVMIPRWGWRSVFYLGGILPLAIALLLIKALPESVRFLTARGKNPAALSKIMRQVAPGIREDELDLSPRAAGSGDADDSFAGKSAGPALGRLFAEGRAAGTILLWTAFFMNLMIMYFIVNWLPGLLQQSGLPASAGVTAILLFSLGGIAGNLGEGRVMNSCGAYATLLGQFAISTLLIGALAFLTRLVRLAAGGDVCARRSHRGRAGRAECAGRELLSHDDPRERSGLGAGSGPRGIDCGADDWRNAAGDGMESAADFPGGNGAGSLRRAGDSGQRQAQRPCERVRGRERGRSMKRRAGVGESTKRGAAKRKWIRTPLRSWRFGS